ncbi:hypothetical protein N182_34045 [Sinorhizobium sp. GL2]|nr:hypothetical protein N182_34045 [Sinorhizobium sp. GL2]
MVIVALQNQTGETPAEVADDLGGVRRKAATAVTQLLRVDGLPLLGLAVDERDLRDVRNRMGFLLEKRVRFWQKTT